MLSMYEFCKLRALLLTLLLAFNPLEYATAQVSRKLQTPQPAGRETNMASTRGGFDRLAERFPYTLDAGDVIALDVFNVPEYSKEYPVLVDGSVSLPLLGRIPVANLTLAEVEQLLTREYITRGYLKNPIIRVNLVKPRPITVAMVGEVRTPGSYSIPFDDGGGKGNAVGVKFPDLITALRLANGINASADTRNVRIIRRYKGQDYTIIVSLWEFLENGDLTQNVILRDGDRIIVPSVREVNPREVLRVATANFSANLSIPITISIVGEVNRPGPYTLTGDDVRASNLGDTLSFQSTSVVNQQSLAGIPTATRAIKTAGGLTARADVRNIEVRRTLPTGEEQVIKVDLWKLLQTGDFTADALLQDGDRIIVPTAPAINEEEVRQVAVASFSPNRINVNVIGEVKNPGLKELPPNVSLQQALLAAGGFDNRRANDRTVRLLRLNPNGTVTERVVKVDFSAPLNEETNPPLLNNDIIFVDRSGLAMASDSIAKVLDPFAQVLSIISGTLSLIDRF